MARHAGHTEAVLEQRQLLTRKPPGGGGGGLRRKVQRSTRGEKEEEVRVEGEIQRRTKRSQQQMKNTTRGRTEEIIKYRLKHILLVFPSKTQGMTMSMIPSSLVFQLSADALRTTSGALK